MDKTYTNFRSSSDNRSMKTVIANPRCIYARWNGFGVGLHEKVSEGDAREFLVFTIFAFDNRCDCCGSDVTETKSIVSGITRRTTRKWRTRIKIMTRFKHGSHFDWEREKGKFRDVQSWLFGKGSNRRCNDGEE